ncbi:MAG: 3-hydroxyacyl-CoA dehydrogenase NAD-binding domain-containing protein [Parvularculaceae bacterium]
MAQATIAVVGGGLMGAGIAQVFAVAGRKVVVHEPFEQVRDTIVDRIRDNLRVIGADVKAAGLVSVTGSLAEAVADAEFVTEAAPEKLDLKQEIFTKLIAEVAA